MDIVSLMLLLFLHSAITTKVKYVSSPINKRMEKSMKM